MVRACGLVLKLLVVSLCGLYLNNACIFCSLLVCFSIRELRQSTSKKSKWLLCQFVNGMPFIWISESSMLFWLPSGRMLKKSNSCWHAVRVCEIKEFIYANMNESSQIVYTIRSSCTYVFPENEALLFVNHIKFYLCGAERKAFRKLRNNCFSSVGYILTRFRHWAVLVLVHSTK